MSSKQLIGFSVAKSATWNLFGIEYQEFQNLSLIYTMSNDRDFDCTA